MKIATLFGLYYFESNRKRRFVDIEHEVEIYYRDDNTIRCIVDGIDCDITEYFSSYGIMNNEILEIEE